MVHQAGVFRIPGGEASVVAAAVDRLAPGGTDHHVPWPGGGITWIRGFRGGTVVVHTWPELGLASVDCYGPTAALSVLAEIGWAA